MDAGTIVLLVMVALLVTACDVDRYLCRQMQSRAPECAQYLKD